MKIRSKIVWLLASIFMVLILAFSIFIYYFISSYSFTDFYERLETRSKSFARIELEEFNDDHNSIKHFRSKFLLNLPEEKNYVIKNGSADFLRKEAKKIGVSTSFLQEIKENNTARYRNDEILFSGIKYKNSKKETFLVITSARNLFVGKYISHLGNLLLVSVLVSAILIVLIAYWLSKRLINPIKQITEKVNKIGTENLNIRLNDFNQDDELGELAHTFNNMLDRLETSFETQNNFISNASHELNTPLTSIIGEADVALARIRTTDEYIETLQNILEEAEKLDKKTKALLFLAQTGFNGKALKFDKVRIDQLIVDVQETINRILPQNKVHIDFSNLPDNPLKLKVNGNEQLLHLAISNIVLNACKYSNNKDVTIKLEHKDDFVVVFVRDKGIGIPESEIRYIYDPFFRASNTGNYEGYGIGLPLTRNIIKLHHGKMIVRSHENIGTDVEIKIPIGKFTL